MNADVSEIIVIKNLNSKSHKLLPTPYTVNCIGMPSFKVMSPGMFDYGMGMYNLGQILVQASQLDLSRRESWAERLWRDRASVLFDVRMKECHGTH